MIVLKNITDEKHKDELKQMLIAHYQELFGPDWADKLPIKYLREKASLAHSKANDDIDEMFGERPRYGTIALGIIDEETSSILGISLVDIFDEELEDNKSDRYGQLYQLYIKPEYRTLFSNASKEVNNLKSSLEAYFTSKNVNEILADIPTEIGYLMECGKALGFEMSQNTSKESGIETIRAQKKI